MDVSRWVDVELPQNPVPELIKYCVPRTHSVVVILDEADKVIYQKKLNNDLFSILQQLSVYKNEITAIAIESTFNWYWLVDGLMDAGYTVKLVNTAAVQTYDGLKHTDDKDDARWLAHLLRLGILPTGYIYPKEERAVRDLLRKRSQLVRQSTTNKEFIRVRPYILRGVH